MCTQLYTCKAERLAYGISASILYWLQQGVHLLAGNVFAVVSQYRKSGWLKASIFLMLAHQGIAYALYFLPLAFMVEKLFRVHTKPLPYRILARLPACKSQALFAYGLCTADLLPWQELIEA